MEKDFEKWNKIKQRVHNTGRNKFYHEREIWWCWFGVNIGSEQDGGGSEKQRPVLILKGLSRTTCLVLPLTRSLHRDKHRVPIGIVEGDEATAVLSQVRVVDTKRFLERIGFLDKDTFEQIRKSARDML